MKFDASLHGAEIRAPRHGVENTKQKLKLSKDQLKAVDDAQKDAQKRIKARYGK